MPTDAAVIRAASILQNGGIVVMPTESVYGLAASALDEKALKQIFALKNRPHNNPLIIHCAEFSDIEEFAVLNSKASKIAEFFCPGPLTLLLPRRKSCRIHPIANANLPQLALRIPAHPIAQALLRSTKIPIAAPSANRSGALSPTKAQHCHEFAAQGITILDGGDCIYGLESTIVDASHDDDEIRIFRHGAIPAETLRSTLPYKITEVRASTHPRTHSPPHPTIPGQLYRHYSPRLPLTINVTEPNPKDAHLAFGSPDNGFLNLSLKGNLEEAARNLFAYLHLCDNSGYQAISVAVIPDQGIGISINERLKKATQKLDHKSESL